MLFRASFRRLSAEAKWPVQFQSAFALTLALSLVATSRQSNANEHCRSRSILRQHPLNMSAGDDNEGTACGFVRRVSRIRDSLSARPIRVGSEQDPSSGDH